MKYKLGSLLKEKISGMEGIAVSHTTYLNGCVRYGIRSRDTKDGKPSETHFMDVEELELIEEDAITVESTPTGGGMNPPAR